jgi:hypothetical protein
VYYDGTDRGEGEGLKIAWKVGTTWITRSILRGPRVGQFPSLSFNSAAKPRVAYFDATEGDLVFSAFEGSAWPPAVQQ